MAKRLREHQLDDPRERKGKTVKKFKEREQPKKGKKNEKYNQ